MEYIIVIKDERIVGKEERIVRAEVYSRNFVNGTKVSGPNPMKTLRNLSDQMSVLDERQGRLNAIDGVE